ncbi:MAG: hypothetical protein JRI31_00795 [Deltaproteobacteria bacterium]|nr:hypothetical protein [Deltaproteobacteria bacterium]
MPVSVGFIKQLENVDPQLRLVLLSLLEEIERQREESVTKSEFNELKKIVRELGEATRELAEAQRRSEGQLTRLEVTVQGLAEAQERSEERLTRLEETVQELAEAQRRSEERLTRLEVTVQGLAEAQERSEERLTRLEETVQELAEAQKRTEKEIERLTGEMSGVKERLEGLSDTVGYTLENRSYKALPRILAQYNLEVEDRLVRRYFKVRGKERQVNIFGYARRDGERMLIIGEVKVRPSKKEISRFENLCEVLSDEFEIPVFKIFVAHDFPPAIEAYLKERNILPIWSYELE